MSIFSKPDCKASLDTKSRLSRPTNFSKTDFILSAINLEYDKLNNNEQVLAVMDKFKELSKELADLTGYQVIDNK